MEARAPLPLTAPREISPRPLSQLCCCWPSLVHLGLELHHSSLYLCLHTASALVCVSLCVSPSLLLKDTVIGFRTTLMQEGLISKSSP